MNLDKAAELFDDVAKIYRVEFNNLAAAVVSFEVDFDLPRGFVAKIKQIYFKMFGLRSATGGDTINLDCAVVNDPDDAVTVNIPVGRTQHDVIADFEVDGTISLTGAAGGGLIMGESSKMVNFEAMKMDVIAARNIRVNASEAEDNAVYDLKVEIYYTMESIKDTDLLKLLDIL